MLRWTLLRAFVVVKTPTTHRWAPTASASALILMLIWILWESASFKEKFIKNYHLIIKIYHPIIKIYHLIIKIYHLIIKIYQPDIKIYLHFSLTLYDKELLTT